MNFVFQFIKKAKWHFGYTDSSRFTLKSEVLFYSVTEILFSFKSPILFYFEIQILFFRNRDCVLFRKWDVNLFQGWDSVLFHNSDFVFLKIKLILVGHHKNIRKLFVYTIAISLGIKINIYRSSHPEVFLRKVILKICGKFTGEHSCQSVLKSYFGVGVLP